MAYPGRVLHRALRGRGGGSRRRRSARMLGMPACRWVPAPTPPGSRPTTPGSRSPGWSPGAPSAGRSLYPRGQPARPRDGAAALDRAEHLVLERAGQEGPDQAGPARRPRRPRPRLLRGARCRDRGHRIRADHARRQGRPRQRRLSRLGAAICRRLLPTGRPCGYYGGYQRAAAEPATTHAMAAACSCGHACAVHGHAHGRDCRRAGARRGDFRASGVRSAAPAGRFEGAHSARTTVAAASALAAHHGRGRWPRRRKGLRSSRCVRTRTGRCCAIRHCVPA